MQPSSRTRMFRKDLRSLSPLLLSVATFILLCSSSTANSDWVHPTIAASLEEARKWAHATYSNQQDVEWEACNVSTSLGFLRSHLRSFLVDESGTGLSRQPLRYSFYVKNVLQPYRSLLSEANAPTTSFCNFHRDYADCKDPNWKNCEWVPEIAVCLPNSDGSTEGTCASCLILNSSIEYRGLKDEASILDLNATCDPVSSRGPKPAPPREKNTTNEARWLRWFLESSYVFEGKKVGDGCSARPALSKARAYVELLMKAHFGPRKEDANVSLATPGKEGGEEERLYEAVRGEMNDEKNKDLYEETFDGIKEGEELFGEVYCSSEEGLVCVKGNCVKCGDEDVERNEELSEACNPGKGEGHRKGGGGSSGAQGGGQMSSELTAAAVGLLLLSTLFGNFRW
jgi:hypothetical protein